MARILLLIAVAFIAYAAWTRYRKLPPPQQKQYFWQVLAMGGGALLLLLVVTGRLHWIGAAFAALIPLARRLLPLSLPFLQHHLRRRAARPASAQGPRQSAVATAILSMTLDHDTGELDGSVTSGPLAGQGLQQLSDAQLLELYAFCCQHDSDSARLLENYLDQRLGANWRNSSTETPGQDSASGPQAMGREEALLVLGLEEGAGKEEIVQAHRRLIQKLHPDRGGNDYLASQINRARDILLS